MLFSHHLACSQSFTWYLLLLLLFDQTFTLFVILHNDYYSVPYSFSHLPCSLSFYSMITFLFSHSFTLFTVVLLNDFLCIHLFNHLLTLFSIKPFMSTDVSKILFSHQLCNCFSSKEGH